MRNTLPAQAFFQLSLPQCLGARLATQDALINILRKLS